MGQWVSVSFLPISNVYWHFLWGHVTNFWVLAHPDLVVLSFISTSPTSYMITPFVFLGFPQVYVLCPAEVTVHSFRLLHLFTSDLDSVALQVYCRNYQ